MSDRPGFIIGPVEHPVQGPMLTVGDPAPDAGVMIATDWSEKRLADYDGKVKIISVVPSLDTGVCSAQTRRFNSEAAALGDDVIILTVSVDLPPAQARWCGSEGIDRGVTLSDHRTMDFCTAFGVTVPAVRMAQRAVFVVDQQNIVRHAEYMHVIGDEVNFEAALAKARELTQGVTS